MPYYDNVLYFVNMDKAAYKIFLNENIAIIFMKAFCINFYISSEFLHFDWTGKVKCGIVRMLRDIF